ncbi:FAD/NAD(P)-binding protein [Glarea lozoyensis ATCC 20868]|uniref:FAD/NAD(P)-binding protein n=1 Tax=Glarea lozoyensis (strain ATCC 20868 / MF5171) TaxID=1116229 RepID=S3CNC5_GLAL2|nr:FAD/NAD(P)-binding protein [Glarea lozoyensis ATCC 20868]EPE27220.1 FAD/NAD(P)-binding protein [Glarea lozoyensis ATCC 20868]
MVASGVEKRVRIAVVGGELAGAILVRALMNCPNLDLQLYEAGAEFGEEDTAIEIGVAGEEALQTIGSELLSVLENAGASSLKSTRMVISNTSTSISVDTEISDLANDLPVHVVRKSSFIDVLLEPVPSANLHTHRSVISIHPSKNGGVHLHFQDGTASYADAVVGADGFQGYTRQHVLGSDYPALSAGREYRALVPIEEARKLLGAIGLTENRQYTWMGKGWLVRLGTFDRDRTAFCIASHIDEKPGVSHDLRQTNDRTFLEKAFKGWGNQVVKNTIISLLLQHPITPPFPLYHHTHPIASYIKSRVCVVGEAANTGSHWDGSGPSQEIEDVLVLSALLAEIRESTELEAVFKSYDEARRPRRQAYSQANVMIDAILFEKTGANIDPEQLREAFATTHASEQNFEMEKYKLEALKLYNKINNS